MEEMEAVRLRRGAIVLWEQLEPPHPSDEPVIGIVVRPATGEPTLEGAWEVFWSDICDFSTVSPGDVSIIVGGRKPRRPVSQVDHD